MRGRHPRRWPVAHKRSTGTPARRGQRTATRARSARQIESTLHRRPSEDTRFADASMDATTREVASRWYLREAGPQARPLGQQRSGRQPATPDGLGTARTGSPVTPCAGWVCRGMQSGRALPGGPSMARPSRDFRASIRPRRFRASTKPGTVQPLRPAPLWRRRPDQQLAGRGPPSPRLDRRAGASSADITLA